MRLMSHIGLNKDTVSWREVENEIVAMDLARSEYITVTESARRLWLLLAAGTTEDALVASLIRTHGIDQARATADVDAFLSDLRARGLIDAT